MALPCGFRGFWFKSLNTHPYLFFCNISLFGKIFAHFLAVSQKNKTFEKNSKSLKKRVVMRFAHKKRITFVWYTKVIPQVYVYYQKVLCYKVCATKRYILGGRKNIVHYFALWLTIGAEGVIYKLTKNVRPHQTSITPNSHGNRAWFFTLYYVA